MCPLCDVTPVLCTPCTFSTRNRTSKSTPKKKRGKSKLKPAKLERVPDGGILCYDEHTIHTGEDYLFGTSEVTARKGASAAWQKVCDQPLVSHIRM